MKKIVYIVGGIAALTVIALGAIAVYLSSQLESEKNKNKTQSARDARWPKNDEVKEDSQPQTQNNEEEKKLAN